MDQHHSSATGNLRRFSRIPAWWPVWIG